MATHRALTHVLPAVGAVVHGTDRSPADAYSSAFVCCNDRPTVRRKHRAGNVTDTGGKSGSRLGDGGLLQTVLPLPQSLRCSGLQCLTDFDVYFIRSKYKQDLCSPGTPVHIHIVFIVRCETDPSQQVIGCQLNLIAKRACCSGCTSSAVSLHSN
jgi:hypothetical protein